jgi:hypothetical protein
VFPLKLLLSFGWAILLFVFTCTDNLEALLSHQMVHFSWNPRPHLTDLLITKDAHFTDPYYLFIKFGHFCGFGFLFLLLYGWSKKRGPAALCTFIYAALTEILQLYFSRDGRLIDMGIDILGVLLV